MKIDISIGNSRKSKDWYFQQMNIKDFIKRISTPIKTAETMTQYKNLAKLKQDDIKDVGGFVLGRFKDNKRKKENLLYRSGISLDMDYGNENTIEYLEKNLYYHCYIYSTHKHTSVNPRLRLIIPLKRNISADEYGAISRMIAKEINMELFDNTTYDPSRLMYWPSISSDGEFIFKEIKKATLNPDDILKKYENWKDCSQWPTSSKEEKIRNNNLKKQEDPLSKSGLIGAFCKAYSISDVMEKFLKDVYEKSETPNRYDYIPATSQAGVVLYDDKFAYSHHATDPACGKLLNAFDLVRIHKFGKYDDKNEKENSKLLSFKKMKEFILEDKNVKVEMAKERYNLAKREFQNKDEEDISWQTILDLDKEGNIKITMENMVNIIKYDKNLKNIVYNEFKYCLDIIGDVPWNQVKKGWSDADMACIKVYFEKVYGLFSPNKFKDSLLAEVSSNRLYHPIKEYFSTLTWDKVERLDNLLIDYLGAEDNEYVKTVTRKTLCAAVARIYEPGIKFDYILVLNGPQGIGKSTFFEILGKEWYSDSLTISDMKDKTAAEKLQGYWILEVGELAGIRRTDVEVVKSFISRKDDKFRHAYGATVESHPRCCIVVGTTNSESGFLRDTTGNRRFWPVSVSGKSKLKPWDIKDVDQIWAEAIYRYNEGESLYLRGKLEEDAKKAQNQAMELDYREGIIMDYLEKPLPLDWDTYDLYKRRSYLNGDEFDFNYSGSTKREYVCIMEIWCECFQKDRSELKRSDSTEIESILIKIGGWERLSSKSGKRRYELYGPQNTFVRVKC